MKMISIASMLILLLGAGCTAPQSKTAAYSVVTTRMGNQSYDAIRWNRATGKSYLLRGQAWQEVPEDAPNAALPKGTYEVQFIPLLNDWGAIRINSETGDSWAMANGQWIAILSSPLPQTQRESPGFNETSALEPVSIEGSGETVQIDTDAIIRELQRSQ
jgi:hypothetical protein